MALWTWSVCSSKSLSKRCGEGNNYNRNRNISSHTPVCGGSSIRQSQAQSGSLAPSGKVSQLVLFTGWGRVSCHPGWPQTPQPPASTSQMWVSQVCTPVVLVTVCSPWLERYAEEPNKCLSLVSVVCSTAASSRQTSATTGSLLWGISKTKL